MQLLDFYMGSCQFFLPAFAIQSESSLRNLQLQPKQLLNALYATKTKNATNYQHKVGFCFITKNLPKIKIANKK